MITCLAIAYIVAIVLVFKILKVRPRPWPIAIFAVVGVLMLGAVVVLWTLAAPMSSRVVVSRYVIQIVPYDKGRVLRVPALPNVPQKKGDTLFEIDPAPFQYAVDQLSAQLESAKNDVSKAEAALEASRSAVTVAQDNVVSTKTNYEDLLKTERADVEAVSQLKVVEAGANWSAARAELREAQLNVTQLISALAVAKSNVVSVQSQLDDAKFNLKVSVFTAPSEGIVTDWQIRPGTFVVPLSLASAGTFIDTSDTFVIASFPAEELLHVQKGQPVELAFNSRPGELFRGKVENVLEATGEGQFAPGGKLPSAATVGSKGFLAVKITLDDASAAHELALGTAGTVAIYTDFGAPFHVISKVTVRMKKWLYFLPLPTS
jgi:membrane fusion protein (multidrug efflux system)